MPHSTVLPSVGQTFCGRYRIDAVLGAGGFGTVLRAQDVQRGGLVALKILRPTERDGYDAATRKRFEREVRIVAALRSPHTVRIVEHGVSPEGLLYASF